MATLELPGLVVEIQAVPQNEGDDAVSSVTGVAVDVPARSQADADRLAQMRGDFVISVGHELDTPLTAIVGYAELLWGTGAKYPIGRS